MRVCITGARGFIGGTIAVRLRADGHDVVGVDMAAGDGTADGIVVGDVTQAGAWQAVADGCDLMIHTAALLSNSGPAERWWAVNVLGTRRALDAARDGGVPRFVHFSSIRAFSDQDFPDGADESWPVRPDGHPYVDTKVASEQVVLQAHAAGEVAATVIRPGDVYGPRSLPWTIWPVSGIGAGSFVVPAEEGIFSPVYVDNLVDGVLAAAGDAGVGGVFTISDGVGVTNADFFGRYAEMLGVELPVMPADEVRKVLEAAIGDGDIVDYFLRTGTYSIERARTVLGYEPKIGLDEGMTLTEAWLRDVGMLG